MAGKKERQRKLARERYQRRRPRGRAAAPTARQMTIVTSLRSSRSARRGRFPARRSGSRQPAPAAPSPAQRHPVPQRQPHARAGRASPRTTAPTPRTRRPRARSRPPPATPDFKATYQATITHQPRQHRHRPAEQQGHLHGQLVRVPGAQELLQQHPLPPADHHRHLRAAVRRPDRDRHGRPRLQVRRREPDRRDVPGRHGGHGQRRRRTPTAASSSSCTRTPSLPASYTPFGTIVSGLNILQNVARRAATTANGAGGGASEGEGRNRERDHQEDMTERGLRGAVTSRVRY